MSTIREQALACREAASAVAALDSASKRALLRDMAAALEAQCDVVLAANAEDMRQAVVKGVQGAMLDRLRLDQVRVAGIADALREVAELPDPDSAAAREQWQRGYFRGVDLHGCPAREHRVKLRLPAFTRASATDDASSP